MDTARNILITAAEERLTEMGYFNSGNISLIAEGQSEKRITDIYNNAKDAVREYLSYQPDYKLQLFVETLKEMDEAVLGGVRA